jgi:Rrf2 family protein
MRLSTRTEYGILAMVDLAEHFGMGSVQSHDIAERRQIPEPYLNQILTLLRKAGLITSRRGPGGGHALARPAAEFSLAELIGALEGPIWETEADSSSDRLGRALGLDDVWREIGETTHGILGRVSLAGIAERARNRTYTYYI